LNSSGIFLSEPDSLKAAAQVIKGFHDFFPYAYEFWFEHLSAVTELVDDGSKLRDIEDAMEKLWLLFRKQSSTHGDIPLVEGPDSVPADESIVNPRLLSLPGPIREYILFKHDKLNTGQSRGRNNKFRKSVFLDLVIPYGVFRTTIIIIRIFEIGPVIIQIRRIIRIEAVY
jgi:hypothetical protein